MNEDTGMNEAPKEVILWAGEKRIEKKKKRVVIQAIIDACRHM